MGTTQIDYTLRGVSRCPACNAPSQCLIVVTRELKRRQRFISDGRGSVEFVGYDCQNCGEELRFDAE